MALIASLPSKEAPYASMSISHNKKGGFSNLLHTDKKDATGLNLVLWTVQGDGTPGAFQIGGFGVEFVPSHGTVLALNTTCVPHGTRSTTDSSASAYGSALFTKPELSTSFEKYLPNDKVIAVCQKELQMAEVRLRWDGTAGQLHVLSVRSTIHCTHIPPPFTEDPKENATSDAGNHEVDYVQIAPR